MTRQQRRALARQQAKSTGQARVQPPIVIVPPKTFAIAREVPTHAAQCAHNRKRVVLPNGRHVGNADFAAWHEAGHATAFLALGLHLFWTGIVRANPAVVDPGLDLWEGQCRPHGPEGMARDAIYRAVAVGVIAGPLAATIVRTGLGLVGKEPHPAEERNPGDAAVLANALDVLGIPQAEREVFEQALAVEARALLFRHRRHFGAIVAALLRHERLGPFELLDIWRSGAFRFQGRIGELIRCPTRDALADPLLADSAFRAILRDRFGCAAA